MNNAIKLETNPWMSLLLTPYSPTPNFISPPLIKTPYDK